MFVNLPKSKPRFMQQSIIELKDFLDFKAKTFNTQSYIETDPLQIPHRFEIVPDIEIAAFLSSQLAWGNRKAIIKAANDLMLRMNNQPWEWIKLSATKELNVFNGFVYRTFNEQDIKFYIQSLRRILDEYGSLGVFFENLYSRNNKDVKQMLSAFHATFMKNAPPRTIRHLANIARGSAGKRLNMLLRWMVRSDTMKVDLGIWKFIPQSELYIPLDVHSGRVARKLGLLDRNADDWKSVEILTERLREFDPNDPVKYDYALFGLGVFEKF
jgi:uncharacterized protein (TIGR02757 family)